MTDTDRHDRIPAAARAREVGAGLIAETAFVGLLGFLTFVVVALARYLAS
jgi:hypothetical protein